MTQATPIKKTGASEGSGAPVLVSIIQWLVLLHEVSLEVLEVFRHGDALLLTLHEGLQTGGNLDVGAEAGRMGSMNLLAQVPVTLIHSFLKEY